ncbi:unnamed protein product [Heligmosomoides polygyrus]|uniref:Uncharacterized protein n=1 Tax=Heligmosomoides polygyrus TaxID=6339 RepID=A0A183GQQ9_HELPZ|nr:unnamed protein product [Heligmosomoides polygyrus]
MEKWLTSAVGRRKLRPSDSVGQPRSFLHSGGEVSRSRAYIPSCRMAIVKPRICTMFFRAVAGKHVNAATPWHPGTGASEVSTSW